MASTTQYGTDTSAAQTRRSQMCFDTAGDLRSVTAPNAGTATITCPGTGPYTGGYTTQIFYDEAHRPTSQRDPLGHEQRTGYDANGNALWIEADIATGRVARTDTDYDQANRPITLRERFDGATGRVVTSRIEYDHNGNQTRMISPRAVDASIDGKTFTFYVTVNSYDADNRLVKTQLPYDSTDGTERQYVHQSYDANGNLTWSSLPVTQADSTLVGGTAKTTMTYFDPGWIHTSDDHTNPAVHFDYTPTGKQVQRTPEVKGSPGTLDSGRQMSWTYFPDQMTASRSDEKGHATSYTYDADNNMLTSTDDTGLVEPSEHTVSTQSTFDGFDEITKTRYQKQGDTNWTFSAYGYDADGNVTTRDENGQEDTSGTQTKAPRHFQSTYDGADWLTEQLDLGTDSTCKDDTRTVNTWWSTGWEKQRDTYRAGTGCTNDPTTWAKKQTTTWTHYDNGKLRQLTTANGAGTVTESHTVGYTDPNNVYIDGNRTTDQYTLTRGAGSTATTCVTGSPCTASYSYDARDRLVSESPRAGKSITYKLDEPADQLGENTVRAGNVTTETSNGTTTTQRYTGNQLTDATTGGSTTKYWYDSFGNMACTTAAAGTQSADCSPDAPTANTLMVNTYDYLQRLWWTRQYSGGTQTDSAHYVNDALDRTTTETEDHAGTTNDRTTTFSYQGMTSQVTQEAQSGGSNPDTKNYSYDSYGHRIGMTDTNNTTGVTSSYTYGSDVHSSVSQLIDDAGTVKASYGYTAYGGADSPSTDSQSLTSGDTNAQAPINPYRFSGRRVDSGTATSSTAQPDYDMGARRYGPNTGRFLQADAYSGALADMGLSTDPLTQNRYSLAGGNPISYMEADGHAPIADGGGGGSTSLTSNLPPSTPPKKDSKKPNVGKQFVDGFVGKLTGDVKGLGKQVVDVGECGLNIDAACNRIWDQTKQNVKVLGGCAVNDQKLCQPLLDSMGCHDNKLTAKCAGGLTAFTGEIVGGAKLGGGGDAAAAGDAEAAAADSGGVTAASPPAAAPAESTAGAGEVALDSGTARALTSADQTVAGRLNSQFGGRGMVMPQTAVDEFQGAVSRLAGPTEKAAAQSLMDRVRVVADNPSDRVADLTETKRVGANDKLIFGTADQLGIPIFTSDFNFLRGAAAQGVILDAFVHPPVSFVGR